MKRVCVLPCLCFVALAASSAVASAQGFVKRNIADHDQRRSAIPNGGESYCVPTAYSDILTFMSQNGMPGLDLGTSGHYAAMTSLINMLGIEMDTDPAAGTNSSDAWDAMVDWFGNQTTLRTEHVAYEWEGSWGVNEIRNWLAVGAMVRISYGRYARAGNAITRTSGHAVAVAGYNEHSSPTTFYVADPANVEDGDPDHQGPFTLDEKPMWDVTINLGGDIVHHARFTNWVGSDGNQLAIVDDMHVILPLWIGWLDPPPHTPAHTHPQRNFHAQIPRPLTGGDARNFDVPVPESINDWSFDPRDFAIYTLDEDGTIAHVDLLAQTSTPVVQIPGARKLTVAGRRFDLFVLRSAGADDEIVRFDPFTRQRISLRIAKGITAIEPDPSTQGIVALHAPRMTLFRIDPELLYASPQAIALPDGTGETFLSVDRKGEVVLARSGARTLQLIAPNQAPQSLALSRAPVMQLFHALAKDRFLIQEGARLALVDATGTLIPGPFDGLVAPSALRVFRGWKAIRKEDVTGPQWRQIPPEPGAP